jgi:hypothetical protein
MGANDNNSEFKVAFDKLVADLHTQFDDIKGQFTSTNDRLTSIKQRGALRRPPLMPAPNVSVRPLPPSWRSTPRKPWRTSVEPSSSSKRNQHRH